MGGLRRLAGHLLTSTIRRDGTATALELDPLADGPRGAGALQAVAGGLSLATLDRVGPDGALPLEDGPPAPHRARLASSSYDLLMVGLSGKILGSWIQNRHQTLYPLAMNFRNVPAGHVALLLDLVAVSLLATGPADLARMDRIYTWMKGVGGGDVHAVQLAYAIDHAPALHVLIAQLHEARLGPSGFAVALAALDQREAVNRLFLEYLAERLGLPSDMARSLSQRFRL